MAMMVSLQDFVASGTFGPVIPGCTTAELEAIFGPPEATGGQSRRHRRPSIWKYGDIQLFFAQPGGLRMVHLDTFVGHGGVPVGWGGLRLEPWCVREGLTLGEFTAAAGAGQVRPEPQFERVVVTLPSGVEVGFTLDERLFGMWRAWTVEPE
jgi:hypothetical protein